MKIAKNVLELIGNTPVVKLSRLCEGENVLPVFAKLERFNPGGSIKDRVAAFMVMDAIEKGALKKGTPIVESTSGNTGVGLAMVCAYLGYDLYLTMPSSMSVERRALLKAYGAKLVLTDAALGMDGAVQEGDRLAKEMKAFQPLQFENPSNPAAHRATASELYAQMDGCIDVLVATIGTGGTISGMARELKKKLPKLHVIGVEPAESPLLSKGTAGSHGIQGIGANFVPKNYDEGAVSEIVCVSTAEAKQMGRRLAREEGLLCGISSGAAAFAALQAAKRAEFAGKNIVCILPDTGERYLSSDMFDESEE